MGLFGTFSSLDNLGYNIGHDREMAQVRLVQDSIDEAEKFRRDLRTREKNRGIGNLLGMVAGLGTTILTGGLSSPILAGLITAGGSGLGQFLATANDKVDVGKFNIADDTEEKDMLLSQILASAGKTGLAAGIGVAGLNKAGIDSWSSLLDYLNIGGDLGSTAVSEVVSPEPYESDVLFAP